MLPSAMVRLLARIATMMWLGRRLVVATSTVIIATRRRNVVCWSAREVDVYATGVCLGVVLQAKLPADLLDARLDLLNVIDGVIALANDTTSMPIRKSFLDQALSSITHTCKCV